MPLDPTVNYILFREGPSAGGPAGVGSQQRFPAPAPLMQNQEGPGAPGDAAAGEGPVEKNRDSPLDPSTALASVMSTKRTVPQEERRLFADIDKRGSPFDDIDKLLGPCHDEENVLTIIPPATRHPFRDHVITKYVDFNWPLHPLLPSEPTGLRRVPFPSPNLTSELRTRYYL